MNKKIVFTIITLFFLVLSLTAMPVLFASENNFNNPPQEQINLLINEVLKLVNNERAKLGLNPLTLDSDLNYAAKIRSEEIIIDFNHTRPDGSSITTLSPKILGENIASGQPTPQIVMKELMDSPTHQENILNPNFTTIGIGYTKYDSDPEIYGPHYWVQLFGSNKDAPKNNTIVVDPKNKLKNIEGLSVSKVTSSKITLKWTGQNTSNANGYQISKYDSKTKSYKVIKTINGTKTNSYTDSGLATVSTNKYKVRSYLNEDGKTYYGNYSKEIKATTKPSTPTTVKASPGNKKVTVSWKKVSKANGYEIYRSNTKDGKYSLKKTVKSGTTTKYTDSNLKKGTYHYKVKSYSTVDKTKVSSDLSTSSSAKVK